MAMKYKSRPRMVRPPPKLILLHPMSAPRLPDECSIRRVAQDALQTKAVEVEAVEGSLFSTYRLRTSPDFFYILKCRPSVHIGLLRHEEARLQTESHALHVLQHQHPASVPRLIAHGDSQSSLGSSYLISGPFQGSVLSDVEHVLSRRDLAEIDRSVGQYVQQLSQIPGPGFGPVNSVTAGSASWARFFQSLVDAGLQDGEDALVNLPYDAIRGHLRSHLDSLRRIDEPRLVVIEMASPKSIVANTRERRISGLLDFSTAVWGDPFLSDCFYKPSAGFIEGFGLLPNRDFHERIRQYLYIIYHAVLAIVRNSYRPSEDNEELDARRNLTMALAQLATISD